MSQTSYVLLLQVVGHPYGGCSFTAVTRIQIRGRQIPSADYKWIYYSNRLGLEGNAV